MRFFRWLAQYLSIFILAFLLAVVVWISAVMTSDPNEQHAYRLVDIQVVGKDNDLLMLQEIPRQARLTIQAPRSIWDRLNVNPNLVRVWIDLENLGPGQHTVPVKSSIDASPVRLTQIDPAQVEVTLEPLLEKQMPIEIVFAGNLPTGYRRGSDTRTPSEASVSGPKSLVEKVAALRGRVDIAGATDTIKRPVNLEALDESGRVVSGVTITPREAAVVVPINLQGGYKNAAVKVITKGQVSPGYRLTNILVAPPTVTLFSNNPQVIEQIPGYVETQPIDLSNLVDDIELAVDLNLPAGVTLVRDRKVVVQVGIAALEGSLTLAVPVEVVGLGPDLQALISPQTIDVIVSGPLNILDRLTPASLRITLDLSGLTPGVYQRQLNIDQSPTDVIVETILPEMVQVTITIAKPTPTSEATPQATTSP
jgi:YbbR domain-containing protein